MKKSFPFYFGLLFCISTSISGYYGCKKKDKNDKNDTTNNTKPAHCSNGIIDQGELDIDCGGTCPACTSVIVAPCTPTNNTATLNGFPDLNITYVTCDIQHDNFTMTCNSANGDMSVTLSGAAPTVNRTYFFKPGAGPSTILDEGQAVVQMNKGFSGSFYASSGKLYVAIKNGKVEATYCNITFKGDQTSGDFPGSGRITCQ